MGAGWGEWGWRGLKAKRQVWGIEGECEGAFPKLCGAVMGIGVEVGESERASRAKTEGVVTEGTEDWGELGEVEILWENLPWGWRLILESLNGILEGED